MAVNVPAPSDIESVVDDSGGMMHPSLFHIFTINKSVCFNVVCHHSSCVSCERKDLRANKNKQTKQKKFTQHTSNDVDFAINN